MKFVKMSKKRFRDTTRDTKSQRLPIIIHFKYPFFVGNCCRISDKKTAWLAAHLFGYQYPHDLHIS